MHLLLSIIPTPNSPHLTFRNQPTATNPTQPIHPKNIVNFHPTLGNSKTEALLEAYPEAASLTNNYGNLALHFTAWKKGPLDVEKLLLKIYPEGAAQKNNHGNLPLHYAAHYNAPLEVVEALYHAYPDGAQQKNNDNNTPLDLAIADGASPNVVALLQGKTVPPTDDEVLAGAKARCERAEKELARVMSMQDGMHDDLEVVLSMLMDIREGHPHALYSAGIHPAQLGDLNALLEQVRFFVYSFWDLCSLLSSFVVVVVVGNDMMLIINANMYHCHI